MAEHAAHDDHGEGLHEDLVKLATRLRRGFGDSRTMATGVPLIAKTDRDGTAWFRRIFPDCYPGRWPHIHFEVYSSVSRAVANGPIVTTSQLALPQAACELGVPEAAPSPQPADR
jgi:hypothetical protein